MDISNDEDLEELSEYLTKNFHKDTSGSFLIPVTKEELKYKLLTPSFNKAFHVVIKSEETGKIMGCILGTPRKLNMGTENVKAIVPDYFCVH